MKPFKLLNKLNNVVLASQIIAPIVDNRLVPYPFRMLWIVTRRCNSRCQMCNIWQEKNPFHLTLENYESIFSKDNYSFIRSLTISGGEPTLRSDLPKLFRLALKSFPNLNYIGLATSGLNTNRTINQVDEMVKSLYQERTKIQRFRIQISLDGIGKVHDEVRGISGFFEKVEKTLQGLEKLRKNFPILSLRLSSVLMPDNFPSANDLLDYAKKNNIEIHFSPTVLQGNYYNNIDEKNKITFSGNEFPKKVAHFFDKLADEDKTSLKFYYKDMAQMVVGANRSRRCMLGFYGFVLEHNGEIFPCVNCEEGSFGNILHLPFEKIWFEGVSVKIRKELRKNCCPTCTAITNVHPVNLKEVIELAVTQKFKPRLQIRNKN